MHTIYSLRGLPSPAHTPGGRVGADWLLNVQTNSGLLLLLLLLCRHLSGLAQHSLTGCRWAARGVTMITSHAGVNGLACTAPPQAGVWGGGGGQGAGTVVQLRVLVS
ncbi:hypothetical protein E2C01_071636 [Portunus trituberculatus]|uniref:Uncharacterized protein n=1 Tax=Portunus trituberculatus TaxID=210409 RepID=A0A5B7I8I3_PORTR|nr:hypothetical protein [Portunus trituberculatus]